MSGAATLPQLLRQNAGALGGRPAIREKNRGIWRSFSWTEYWQGVQDFALGLAAEGFRRGDKLSVIGDNRPRLYWAQIAAQALGGVAVPVYQDSIAAELAYVFDHAEVSVIVAEDQEQVDKVLSLKERLPHLRLVIYDDPRGLVHYEEPLLRAFDRVGAAGREFGAAHPDYLEAAIDRGAGNDLALLSYTSGTTGHPKGVMLSHANLLWSAEAFCKAEEIRREEEWLCYLPMAWIGDSLFSIVLHLLVGFTCNCPEEPATVQRDLRELGPTAVLAPPRIWENMLTSVRLRAADASPVKRRLFDFFTRLAERAEKRRSDGKKPSPTLCAGLMLGEFVVYGPVRDQLGLGRARWAYTGGAALGPDTFRFLRAFGVNLKQVYGATELSGLISLQPDGEADPDTVGRLFPGVELRAAPDGEVLLRSGGLFQGYYKDPAATAAAIDAEGWFHSGDAGHLDTRQHLVVLDRAKDLGRLADGTRFAPQVVENKLKFSPYIGEAVTFGDGREFVAAIVAIDLGTVGNWAERHNLAYTSFHDLSGKPEVRRLIAAEITKCSASLPASARVRRFLLLNKEFDPDDDEITRTRKIRRRFVAEKYAALIDALYGGLDRVELETAITYEDGRTGLLRSTIAIDDIAPASEVPREPAYA